MNIAICSAYPLIAKNDSNAYNNGVKNYDLKMQYVYIFQLREKIFKSNK